MPFPRTRLRLDRTNVIRVKAQKPAHNSRDGTSASVQKNLTFGSKHTEKGVNRLLATYVQYTIEFDGGSQISGITGRSVQFHGRLMSNRGIRTQGEWIHLQEKEHGD